MGPDDRPAGLQDRRQDRKSVVEGKSGLWLEFRRVLCRSLSEAEIAAVDVGSYPAAKFHDDIARVTEDLSDPALSGRLVDQSYPTMLWMREMGMRWALMTGRQAFKIDGKIGRASWRERAGCGWSSDVCSADLSPRPKLPPSMSALIRRRSFTTTSRASRKTSPIRPSAAVLSTRAIRRCSGCVKWACDGP